MTTLAEAASGTGRCLIQIDGQTKLDRPCRFEAQLDRTGSTLTIGVTPKGARSYSAMVATDQEGAEAFWNGDERASHMDRKLGAVTPDETGDCWVNPRARICVRY
jgi:hypothetical protein